jgi:hypothetical protein
VLLRTHLIVLPVRILTHCGIGLFCFNFFASFRLILNVLCADCNMNINMDKYFTRLSKIINNMQYDSWYEIRYINHNKSSPLLLRSFKPKGSQIARISRHATSCRSIGVTRILSCHLSATIGNSVDLVEYMSWSAVVTWIPMSAEVYWVQLRKKKVFSRNAEDEAALTNCGEH